MLCLLIHGRFVPLAGAHVEPADALTTLRTAYRKGKKTLFHGALCGAVVHASPDVFTDWREIPLRILSERRSV
jgi:hypothetical protein